VLTPGFYAEEYHGGAHQVRFSGSAPYLRSDPRCELSDLLIVVYSPRSRRVRLTYLQAKSERLTISSVCGHRFSANLEQWFLLSTRPSINGVGSFAPPADLLSGALLPSVGTFAFFFKDLAGHFEIYYASASFLAPAGTYGQRYGTLAANGPCHSRYLKGL
jgi:hypothetical protein